MGNIDKIRAEIKKRYNYEKEMYCDTKPDGRPNDGWAESLAIMGVLEDLLSFLDALEEEPDKSLEEAAMRYAIPAYMKDVDDNYLHEYPRDPIAEKAFIAGAQWQEKRNEETIKTAEDHAFLAGADWQKEQMLKDAVDGEAEELYNDGESQCTVGVGTYFKPGERVYVLKAMEDEE